MQQLFSLRRLTLPQVARLCGLAAGSEALRFFIARLRSLGLVDIDDVMVGCDIVPLLKLTETGHRQAATAMRKNHADFYRDYLRVDFCAHLIRTNELYLALVVSDRGDWVTARKRSALFEWRPSNDDTQFIWDSPGEFEARKRRVVPDVVIETATHRVFVEIERSTKTQKAVERKFEQYCHLFSKLRNLGDGSAYTAKYRDDKKPSVAFVFDSDERSLNARRHFERRADLPGFHIPAWSCGTIANAAQELLPLLTGGPAPKAAQVFREDEREVVRQFVLESTKQLMAIRDAVQGNRPVPWPEYPASLENIRKLLRS